VARDKFRYEASYAERVRPLRTDDDEPVLGPYETRYLIDMGYTAAPRTVS
jgi:hypothetical protein